MGYDPYGLICLSRDTINAASGFAGGFTSGLIDTKNPWAALGLGGINAVVSYNYGSGAGYATTGAIAGGTSGTEGSAMASFSGGLFGGLVSSLPQKVSPNGYAGSGLKSLVNGGISGAAGGLAASGTTWVLDQFNKEFGDCDCGQ